MFCLVFEVSFVAVVSVTLWATADILAIETKKIESDSFD
jgi:hypothetical protein